MNSLQSFAKANNLLYKTSPIRTIYAYGGVSKTQTRYVFLLHKKNRVTLWRNLNHNSNDLDFVNASIAIEHATEKINFYSLQPLERSLKRLYLLIKGGKPDPFSRLFSYNKNSITKALNDVPLFQELLIKQDILITTRYENNGMKVRASLGKIEKNNEAIQDLVTVSKIIIDKFIETNQ